MARSFVEQIILTEAQHSRLDRMEEEAKVIGVNGDDPVVRRGSGAVVVINGHGRLVRAPDSFRR